MIRLKQFFIFKGENNVALVQLSLVLGVEFVFTALTFIPNVNYRFFRQVQLHFPRHMKIFTNLQACRPPDWMCNFDYVLFVKHTQPLNFLQTWWLSNDRLTFILNACSFLVSVCFAYTKYFDKNFIRAMNCTFYSAFITIIFWRMTDYSSHGTFYTVKVNFK